MQINQLSIFVENKAGRLMEIVNVLKENNVNISALSLADTTDFGVLRMIVCDPDKAKTALRESGVIVKTTPVLALPIDDTPGGLAAMLSLFCAENIAVEYMYAFATRTNSKAVMVLRVDDVEKAQKLLLAKGFGDLDSAQLFSN